MKYCIAIVFSFILFSTISCRPYDSDEANRELIQGSWKLLNVEHSVYDSIYVDYAKEETFLIFKGDSCREYMVDLADTLDLSFIIRDYHLAFVKNDTIIGRFSIDSLTDKTLILSFEKDKRIYKKEAIEK